MQGGDITDSRDNDNRRRAETLLAEYIPTRRRDRDSCFNGEERGRRKRGPPGG